MSPAAFLVVAAPAAAIFAAPRAPLGGRHTRCSIGLQADEAIADSRRAFLAQQRPTSGTEAFANTQWSLLLKMKGGGGTMFSVELREDMCCRFSDNDETGSWEAKEEWVVIEKPKGMFGDTLYLSAKLQLAADIESRDRLVKGVVQRLGGSSGSTDVESALADGMVSRTGGSQSVTAQAAAASAPNNGELKDIGSFGGITQLDADAWVAIDE